MALPTIDNLKTMDYSYKGEPFVNVPAKLTIELSTMDYLYKGEPFVSNGGVATLLFSVFNTITISENLDIKALIAPLNIYDTVTVTENVSILVKELYLSAFDTITTIDTTEQVIFNIIMIRVDHTKFVWGVKII